MAKHGRCRRRRSPVIKPRAASPHSNRKLKMDRNESTTTTPPPNEMPRIKYTQLNVVQR